MFALEQWHQRFEQQARWTGSVRRFLFQQANVTQADTILEVGCGSGAILQDLAQTTGARLAGIDLKLDYLKYARFQAPRANLVCGDGLSLPFKAGSFSHTCCHYFLLWVSDPLQSLAEMRRVTQPGGFILALAEPDYGGRIDYPETLVQIGRLQAQSLQRQGADPSIGRKLRGLFRRAGLRNVAVGVLGGQWSEPLAESEQSLEWQTLATDLAGEIAPDLLADLENADLESWRNGERILYVPTFYAIGQV